MGEILNIYYFKNNIEMENVDLSIQWTLITTVVYNWNKSAGYGFQPMAFQSFCPKVVISLPFHPKAVMN